MSPPTASRIQSTQVPLNADREKSAHFASYQAKAGRAVGKNSFASRAQSAAATNTNKGVVGGAPAGESKASGGTKAPKK